ncbi:MAG: NAD(P)/FAD-dependent oxidoreductase [Rhodobacterales bacterium]
MIENESLFIADSLWSATANSNINCNPLIGENETEIAIIGAGYTGLSAALHLSEKNKNIVVLDSENPGWGASGRNGGQVNPGLKEDPDEIEAKFGVEVGRRIVEMSGSAPELVFSLIKKYNINCDPIRSGWIRAAHSEDAFRKQVKRAKDWQSRGVPIQILNSTQIEQMIGTNEYCGGTLDPRGGNLHPLNYVLGLANAILSAGVTIYGQSKARKIVREDGAYAIHTDNGVLRASKVLLCTNGYTDDLVPPLERTIIPVQSVQVATAPLSDNILKSILPGKQAPSDTRRSLLYYRLDSDGRFIMGGRGGYTKRETLREHEKLRLSAHRMFPQLKDVTWQHAWGGYIAITTDHYPHLNLLDEGMIAGLGYNGRGVAMATAMGKVMADWALNVTPDKLDFPLTLPRKIPFHKFSKLGVKLTLAKYKLLDVLGL